MTIMRILDPRTPLLPPHDPDKPAKSRFVPLSEIRDWYNGKPRPHVHNDVKSVIESLVLIGPSRGRANTTYRYHKRYGAIVVKDNQRFFGKIITEGTIDEWAKENGYTVERSFRIDGHVNPEREKTELTDCKSL